MVENLFFSKYGSCFLGLFDYGYYVKKPELLWLIIEK